MNKRLLLWGVIVIAVVVIILGGLFAFKARREHSLTEKMKLEIQQTEQQELQENSNRCLDNR
jgi:uncharacterized membrane protein